MYFLIALLVLLIAGFVLYLTLKHRKKVHTDFVLQHSVALKRIRDINSKFSFYDIQLFSETHTYDNEVLFDSISCQDYLIYQLQFKRREVLQEINKAEYNMKRFQEYRKEVEEIDSFGMFDAPIEKLNLKLLKAIETESFKRCLKQPCTEFGYSIYLNCSQINGVVYRRKSDLFYPNTIQALISKLNNKNGTFYNDRSIWDAICRVERGKVSNKMRFSIYKRDGYRCRMCGRTGRFVDLEIDHIKPIAKGGKSTYSNLQTLCKRCNQLKGDTYYE